MSAEIKVNQRALHQGTQQPEYPQEIKNIEKFYGNNLATQSIKLYIDTFGVTDEVLAQLRKIDEAITEFKKEARTAIRAEISELLRHTKTSYLSHEFQEKLFTDLVKGLGANDEETAALWAGINSADETVRNAAEKRIYELSETSLETMEGIVVLSSSLEEGNQLGRFSNLIRILERVKHLQDLVKELAKKYAGGGLLIVPSKSRDELQKEIVFAGEDQEKKTDDSVRFASQKSRSIEPEVRFLKEVQNYEIARKLEEDIEQLENEALHIKVAIEIDRDGNLPLSLKLGSLESEIRLKRKLLNHYTPNLN